MSILAAIIITIAALLGVGLTLLTLPGIWFAVLVAVGVALWQPELISWPTLIVVIALAVIGEVVEFVWSAVGAAKQGASRAGGIGALVGGFVGAILATFLIPIPILGTLIGAVLGAAIGAIVIERGYTQRTWRDSFRIGQGAAVGRLWAVVVKTLVAAIAAGVLITAAWL